tara:strand:+ start:147 stop:620 length:474 start_codon:yes stop_codon:yes gene_type:complete
MRSKTQVSMRIQEGLTEDDELFGVDPYYLKSSEKKIYGSVKAKDLWAPIPSVVRNFNNLIKNRVDDTPIDDTKKGFVYFIRNQDLYKIGIAQNLLRRLNQLKPSEVLDVVRCSNFKELKKELHTKFIDNRITQTKYFRLKPDQVEKVHELMTTKAKF